MTLVMSALYVRGTFGAIWRETRYSKNPQKSRMYPLFFANQGEFRINDYEVMMNKASCLSLLSNAVVLWNTLQMERVVHELRADNIAVADEHLSHVWPLQRRHIVPNGVYFVNRTMPTFVLPEPVEA
jgi:hypothetical protein